jgi:hypothetical protein
VKLKSSIRLTELVLERGSSTRKLAVPPPDIIQEDKKMTGDETAV